MKHYIDNLSDNIINVKTKEYFEEVLQTYYSKSFRSSVVMLYSVVISDLVFKLEELRDIYNNDTANKILEDIEKKQQSKPNSPDWEIFLIEEIKTRTSMLDSADYQNIIHLQKHRHLSAHPVLSKNSKLYKPNQDTVRAHIRNMLEGVLTKPPFLSENIFKNIIIDLSYLKNSLPNKNSVQKFLFSKYLNQIKPEQLIVVFKKFWKIVFKLNDRECNENRNINLIALEIIIEQTPEKLLLEEIKNNHLYYGQDILITPEELKCLFKLLFKFPNIYKQFDYHTKLNVIDYHVNKKNNFDLIFLSIFKYTSLDEYSFSIIKNDDFPNFHGISQDVYDLLKVFFEENDYEEMFFDILIFIFSKSNSYNSADSNYKMLISPILNRLNIHQFKKLIKYIDDNSQINNRGMAKYDHLEIKNACDKINDGSIDYDNYRNFKRHFRQ